MSLAICRGCGWGAATSDGYCLECAPPDDGMEPWERCGCAACQDTMAQLYGDDEDAAAHRPGHEEGAT